MASLHSNQLFQMETTCGSLLYELQLIWDEVGEIDSDRDRMLLEIEQECLDVYRRRVDQANSVRAQLQRSIADAEAKLASICSAMGEPLVHTRKNTRSLKEEVKAIIPQLEETRRRKNDRLNHFLEVSDNIVKIILEIRPGDHASKIVVDESDLSITMLEELQRQLQSLQKEKSDRLKQVLDRSNTLNSLCSVLGMEFKQTIREIHPTLDYSEGSVSICNDTIERLDFVIQRLREVKIQRMQKLQDLATTMLELWNLMDTPIEEQQSFQKVTCNIAASEQEITEPNTLSVEFINYVAEEVHRLEQLKVSKMKDILLKKKTELEELRRRTHLVAEIGSDMEFPLDAVEAGAVDASLVLEQIEIEISSVKEEAFSRKEILEKVEKWLAACNEESWLEEYNRDENRYSAGRGSHLTLKRAEKARAMVNKIPGLVEALTVKVTAWENERGSEFKYDSVRVLSMLEEYMIVKREREEERKRKRDQKRLQGQLIAEQEVLFGSKPSPSPRPQSSKKVPRTSTGCPTRRLSLGGGTIMQPPKSDSLSCAKSTRSTKKGGELYDISPGRRGLDVAPLAAKKLPFNNSREVLDTPRRPFTPLAGANSIPVTPHQPIHPEYDIPMEATPISHPKTPQTVSAMQMATAPAASCIAHEAAAAAAAKAHEIDYSFEERRLELYL